MTEKFARHLSETVEQSEKATAAAQVVGITWETARDRMLEHNLELRQSRAAVITADAAIDRVWLDMLPLVTMTYTVNRAMTGAGDGTQSNFSVFGFLNLPGLIGTRMRYYGAVLAYIRAEYGYAMKSREQTIALWQTFRDARLLEDRRQWAQYLRQKNLISGQTRRGGGVMTEYLSEYALKREQWELSNRLSRLLGDNATTYLPVDDPTLPKPDYTGIKIDLRRPEKWGRLLNQYTATELEGARLRRLGATLAYWPDVNLSLTSPALYSRDSTGREDFFNTNQVRAQASTTFRLDSTLAVTYSLRETKRQVALLHATIRQSTQERVRKLHEQEEYADMISLREEELKKRLLTLLAAPAATGSGEYAAWGESFRSVVTERDQLARERDQLNTLYWFLDETAWPDPMREKWTELDRQKIEAELDFLDQNTESSSAPSPPAFESDLPCH